MIIKRNNFWKFIILILSILTINSCKKDDGTGPVPSVFIPVFPHHKTKNVNPDNLEISWEKSVDENGPVTYDVYFGSTFPPPNVSKGKTLTSYKPPLPLADSTKYYWRVKAVDSDNNKTDMYYVCFTTRPKIVSGTFTDTRDGKEYKTIKIGSQTWMAENYAFDTTGSFINSSVQNFVSVYGRYYSSELVKSGKLAPKGWHIPSKEEINTLINFFPNGGQLLFYQELLVGGCGFNALLAGYCNYSVLPVYIYEFNESCYIWTSTLGGNSLPQSYFLGQSIFTFSSDSVACNVRCIKD